MTRRPVPSLREVLAKPTWPGTLERPGPEHHLGVAYDTSWARTPPARLGRALLLDALARPFIGAVAAPVISGLERLSPLEGPVIFAANHSSHLDTTIVLSCLPSRFRHKTVVAAAADYFFDRQWKAALWALTLGTIPIDRSRVNRQGADLAASLLEDGWNLVIFPEGGRSADGWGQEFKGGAAYLAKRCAVPVVPVHLQGVRPILAKGARRLRPGRVQVRFGQPLRPRSPRLGEDAKGEDARRFAARIEKAVAALADEAATDWWSARRRAAAGATPNLRGPDVAPWRRAWALPESSRPDGTTRRLGPAKPW